MEPVVVHINEADAVRDIASILRSIQSGAEVVIERDAQPFAVIRAATPVRRTISECIALAETHERETGTHAGRGFRGRRRRSYSEPHTVESSLVGLILDSSVVIAGERRGHTVRQIVEQIRTQYAKLEVALSVVTIVELAHGIQRAVTGGAGTTAAEVRG
jgi:antitoxin (DNA-binding transcriptional repressor) of toxin-antitoxin stability system